MNESTLRLKIPTELLNKLNHDIKRSAVNSLNELIIILLQEYHDRLKVQPEIDAVDEEAEIKKRLENLGYM